MHMYEVPACNRPWSWETIHLVACICPSVFVEATLCTTSLCILHCACRSVVDIRAWLVECSKITMPHEIQSMISLCLSVIGGSSQSWPSCSGQGLLLWVLFAYSLYHSGTSCILNFYFSLCLACWRKIVRHAWSKWVVLRCLIQKGESSNALTKKVSLHHLDA